LEVGQIECPRCVPHATGFHDPSPVTPGAATGGPLVGLAVGLAVAVIGAFFWAWLVSTTGISTWPAVLLGTAIGAVVRLTGGENQAARAVIGLFCGVVGIVGGVALIARGLNYDAGRIGAALSVANIAFVFVGLSLAKSISSGKAKPQPIS
jgi:hypothetical protein